MYLETMLCHIKLSSSDVEGGGEISCFSAPDPNIVLQLTFGIVFILLLLALTFFVLPFSDSLFYTGATGCPHLMIVYYLFPISPNH